MGTRHPATRWSLLYKAAHSAVRITIQQRSLSVHSLVSPLPCLSLFHIVSLSGVTDCPSVTVFFEAVRPGSLDVAFPFRSFATGDFRSDVSCIRILVTGATAVDVSIFHSF